MSPSVASGVQRVVRKARREPTTVWSATDHDAAIRPLDAVQQDSGTVRHALGVSGYRPRERRHR